MKVSPVQLHYTEYLANLVIIIIVIIVIANNCNFYSVAFKMQNGNNLCTAEMNVNGLLLFTLWTFNLLNKFIKIMWDFVYSLNYTILYVTNIACHLKKYT